ncbi:MAG: hypothetical protein EA385_10655 [Salinarimonadaceae bacterium]|nr:MAG: hypothetical protein EA385_10655 [Salinarimonadaceae bacterium]
MALPPVPVYTRPFDAFTPLASLGQSFQQGLAGGQNRSMNNQTMMLRDLAMEHERQDRAAPGEMARMTLAGLGMGGMGGPAMQGQPQPMQGGQAPTMRMPQGAAGGLKGQFMSTVKGAGLTNPFGLAAVAATGQRESGFDPRNATRTWSDPSESGQPGTSGGIMSWRGPRLQAMQQFAQQRGDRPDAPSVETQAMFFAQEDPTLIQRLNAAQSPEEAAQIMAQAWRFAGFNRPGGEAAARTDLTRQFAGMFGGQADAPAQGARPAQGQGQPQPPGEIIDMLQSQNPRVQQEGYARYQAWEQARAPRDPMTLSAGATVFDPNTNQPIFTAPRAEEATPSSVREYEFARSQGYQGTFAEFQQEQRSAGATNVDARQMGTIPPGYRARYDESGNIVQLEPIPGGPVARGDDEAAQKAEQRQRNIEMAGGTVVQDIGRGLEILSGSNWAAGPPAVVASRIPGTPAYQLNQFVQSVASNIGVDRLQAMREASPTGGALGQVPFQQQQRLEQLLGSLDITQPPQVLEANMKRISNLYMDLIHGTPDQVRTRGAQMGLSPDQIEAAAQRFDLPFDEMGRSRSGSGGGSGSQQGAPSIEDIDAELRRRGVL